MGDAMMNTSDIHQFVENKIYLINTCIGINKEILEANDDIDLITTLIEQRALVLKTIEDLGSSTDKDIIAGCTQGQKDMMNRTLTLLLDMDNEIIEKLTRMRSDMMVSIKNSNQNKSVLKYAGYDFSSVGGYLDLKK